MRTQGTLKGGKRPGAGGPKKDGDLRVLEGRTIPIPRKKNGEPKYPTVTAMKAAKKFDGWLTADQASEISEDAVAVVAHVIDYCASKGLAVEPDDPIILGYSLNFARWKQCQKKLNEQGLLDENGNENAYGRISREYGKLYINYWYCIQQAIQTDGRQSNGEQSDDMEALLDG